MTRGVDFWGGGDQGVGEGPSKFGPAGFVRANVRGREPRGGWL